MHNLLPGRLVTSTTLTNQFGSFVGSQSSCSPHFFSPPEYIKFCYAPCSSLAQAELRFAERESSGKPATVRGFTLLMRQPSLFLSNQPLLLLLAPLNEL